MRLLIYGGIEHSERLRVGDWSAIPTEMLGDSYGLKKDQWTFGVGLENKQAFLILRTLTLGTKDRLYPFTILFEPDFELWRLFQWNAALLAYHLVVNPHNSAKDDLLHRPEYFNQDKQRQLNEILRRLGKERFTKLPHIEMWAALVAGSLLSGKNEIIRPENINAVRPQISEVAVQLESLPPCFRIGAGWLMGGGGVQAQPFGVKLIFDDGGYATNDSAPSPNLLEQGRELNAAWDTIAADSDFSKITEGERALTPVGFWSDFDERERGANLLRLTRLARLLQAQNVTDKELVTLEQNLPSSGWLSAELSEAYTRLIAAQAKLLSPARAHSLLDKYFAGSVTRQAVVKASIARNDYLSYLSGKEFLPNDERLPLQLSIEEAIEIWEQYIVHARSAAEAVDIFANSIAALNAEISNASEFGPELRRLAQKAYKRTKQAVQPLKLWFNYRRDSQIRQLLGAAWREEVKAAFLLQPVKWERDYLAFGDDMNGELLANDANSTILARKVWKFCLPEIEKDGEMKPEALEWMRALPASRLRFHLSPEDKNKIAASPLADGWHNFIRLRQIISGSPPAQIEMANDDEKPFLVEELGRFFNLDSKLDLQPSLESLTGLLGEIPADLLASIENRHRLLHPASVKQSPPKKSDAAETVIDDTDPQWIKNLVAAGFSADADAANLCDAQAMLEAIEEAEQLKYEISLEVAALLNQAPGRESVIAGCFDPKSIMRRFFVCFPHSLQIEILQLMSEQSEMKNGKSRFIEMATRHYRRRLSENSSNYFDEALWEFLYSPAGEAAKIEISNREYGNADEIDGYLQQWITEIAQRYEPFETLAADPEGGEAVADTGKENISLLSRLKKMFGRSPKSKSEINPESTVKD